MNAFSDSKSARASALRLLDQASYSSLSTYRRDGSAVPVPVWHAVAGTKVYIFTEAGSWKVKRLRRDPRVAITTCDWRGGNRGGEDWHGVGRVVVDAATVAKAYAALDRKYGWQKWLVDTMSKFSGRYDQRAILEIELDG